MEVAGNK